MKVLEKGRAQKGWAIEARCTGSGNGGGGCKAKLLVEEGDIYLTHSGHYDGSNEKYTTFRCPECSVETDIADGRVPGAVLDRMRDKPRRRR